MVLSRRLWGRFRPDTFQVRFKMKCIIFFAMLVLIPTVPWRAADTPNAGQGPWSCCQARGCALGWCVHVGLAFAGLRCGVRDVCWVAAETAVEQGAGKTLPYL